MAAPSDIDRAALGRLFEEHGPRLRSTLQARIDPVMRARLDAEEILQEA